MADVTDATTSAESRSTEAGGTCPIDTGSVVNAERTFSISIAISAVRCTLTYVLIPWVFPFLGETTGVGPAIGLVIGVSAIVANVFSIRRFHRSNHRWKWHITFISCAVIGLLIFLVANDLTSLID